MLSLGILPGDLVVIDPEATRPVTIEREVTGEIPALWDAVRAGQLEPLTPHSPSAALIPSEPPAVYAPSGSAPRRRGRHLRRLK
jgi:hypothetical protein